jgi:hypothetical protein
MRRKRNVARRTRRVATALVALAPVLLLGGCGDEAPSALPAGSGPAGAPAAAAAAATTTPPPAQPVVAGYLRFWDAVIAAHRASDPALPVLAATAADPQLGRVRKAVAVNRQQRISLRGTVAHRTGAVRVTGSTASVEDCYDLSKWDPVDVRTGAAIDVTDSSGTGRYHYRYLLRRSAAGPWVVTDQVSLGGC